MESIAVMGWLGAIAWVDCRKLRVPNIALLLMIAVTLGLTVWRSSGLLGVSGLEAAEGAAIAAALFVPSYAIRGVGAGDAKLGIVIGALLGPHRFLAAMLISALALGVASVVATRVEHFRGIHIRKIPAALPIGVGVAAVLVFPSWCGVIP